MLKGIGTNYFNVDASHLRVASYRLPLASGQFNRIARIRNNADTEPKIVSGDAIRQTITLTFDNNST